MSVTRITPIQGLVLVGLFALIVFAISIASQSYFSYVEVTEASIIVLTLVDIQ